MEKDIAKVYNSFVFPCKRFPVLPTIFMYSPHSKDRDKYQKKPHDAKAPRSLHNKSNEQLYVVHL